MDRGYFTAKTGETNVTIVDVGGGKFRVPPFYFNKPGKRANVIINVEEGRQYKLNKITFAGVKLFRAPEALMQPIFGMAEGDVFSTEKLRKGMEQIRKLYGEYGYIDMVPEPQPEPLANTDKIDLTLSVDEGSQFFVRRIDFSGNSTTRDKVIRREIVLDEGAIYNTRLWDLSVLRLNQLGFFEPLKENEAAEVRRDTRNSTVDITLKLKERGKNSVTLNGGVSGISGSFIGFGYSTNNFLGLGETLSVDSQIGDRIRNVTVGFTEPYLLDRPITAGVTLYTQQFNYDQGREVSLLTGRNLSPLYNALGTENLLNYVTNGFGGSIFVSSPARRLGGIFARIAMSYSYGVQNIKTETTASREYFQYISYQGLEGENSLSGIRTSAITPSYTYNSIDHPITPSRGKSIFISAQLAGPGGNVRMVAPTFEFKWFRSGGIRKGNVFGMHFLGRTITGFGGRVAPPTNRFYMGGENDIRGFDNWGVSPIAYVPSSASVPLLNADGSARTQRTIVDGVITNTPVYTPIPIYQLIFPGGDTQGVVNVEYRIPIAGPVTLAGFFDAGINKIARPQQLRINSSRVDSLNGLFPQASFTGQAVLAGNTGRMRSSTGLEMQIMMPVVNAPFRFYYAYNPQIVQEFLIPPIVADRSYFPNQVSYLRSVALFAQASPFFEKRTTFRFTISRTF
jgi:outer membrane protein insertion porin family